MHHPTREDVDRFQGAEQVLGSEDQFTLTGQRQHSHSLTEVHGDPLLLRPIVELDRVLGDRRPACVDIGRIDYAHRVLLTSLPRARQPAGRMNARSAIS